jgi:hypothetical protein
MINYFEIKPLEGNFIVRLIFTLLQCKDNSFIVFDVKAPKMNTLYNNVDFF